MSLVIDGTATVSAMLSTTRTSELRQSTMRIHQRRGLRVSMGLPSDLRTTFLRCEHCTHSGTVCATSLHVRWMRTVYALGSAMAAKTNQSPSVWTRQQREPDQPALSRAAIVREAVAMLDAEGIDALSMRKLGA